MFALAGWMLDGEDDNFLNLVVNSVIDQIRIPPRHQLTYGLDLLLPSDMRKQNQTLKRLQNRGPPREALPAGYVRGYSRRSRRDPEPHAA